MNDALNQQLLAMLQGLTDAAKTGGAWVAGQIPPLVAEKIAFGKVWEISYLVIAVIMAGLFVKLTVKCWSKGTNYVRRSYGDDGEMGWYAAMLLTAGVALFFIIDSFITLRQVLLVWFAPRLYIVEWLMELMKEGVK
jgi:hypothetical protein